MGFLAFDPAHRHLLMESGSGRIKACILVFNADTGDQVGVIGSCDPQGQTVSRTSAVFSIIDSAAVDITTGNIVVADTNYNHLIAPDYRIQIIDSSTFAYVAGFDTGMDENIFWPKSVTANQGIAYVLCDDPGTSAIRRADIYDLTRLKGIHK
jgi:hypothetical protein